MGSVVAQPDHWPWVFARTPTEHPDPCACWECQERNLQAKETA